MNAVIDLHKLIPAWQALQSAAPLAHIDDEADYEQATTLLNSLLDAVRDDASHPLCSLVSVVGDLIEAYEKSTTILISPVHLCNKAGGACYQGRTRRNRCGYCAHVFF